LRGIECEMNNFDTHTLWAVISCSHPLEATQSSMKCQSTTFCGLGKTYHSSYLKVVPGTYSDESFTSSYQLVSTISYPTDFLQTGGLAVELSQTRAPKRPVFERLLLTPTTWITQLDVEHE
jgi:hypothetical protein